MVYAGSFCGTGLPCYAILLLTRYPFQASGMVPSADMLGRNARGALAIRLYFEETREIALYLHELFKVSFPDDAEKYAKAFAAGVWEHADPGPWLGRAIVWKLQVNAHRDSQDEGPAAIFNLGTYSGGDLYLPDANLKFR